MKFIHINNSTVNEEILSKQAKALSGYIAECAKGVRERDYDRDEASLCLVDDVKIMGEVKKTVRDKKTARLKYIIDIGIGGSNLGTKAIYDALLGDFDLFQESRYPKIIFLDTTDPEFLARFSSFFQVAIHTPEEVFVNIISKSGGTTETAANGELVLEMLRQKFEDWKGRVVVTTDKDSRLWSGAVAQKIQVMEIPKKVGGRYSVFSAVGLLPLSLCGIQVEKLLEGARTMRERCLRQDWRENSALASAILLFEHLQRGIAINDNFFFHRELESLGKWYRQLMGESTGKQGMGLTPTVSIGSTDLHSVVQLYLGGPKNKYTSFVYTDTFVECPLPQSNTLSHIKEIEGKSVGYIMGAIQQGTIAAYKNLNLPYSETVLDGVNEEELGAYMQYKMAEMMFLGRLMGINTFDQPQVELYKTETKKVLAKNK